MSLNRLLEMQKAAKQKVAQPVGGESVEAAAAKQVPEGETPPVETPAPAPKKLPFGNKQPATPKPTPKPAPKAEAGLSLDNLGSFDLSTLEDSGADDPIPEFSGFHDEIEATAPDRELPEDMTPDMVAFVENLDSVYLILNDSEMFGQQVRTIMMELQENPEYEKLISDTDVHVMIRAMRNTMGLARVKKQSKQRKSGTTTKSRTPSKKQALMDKALGLSIGIPGLGDDFE